MFFYSYAHANKASVKDGRRECRSKEQRKSLKKGTEKEKKEKEAH